MHRTATAPAHRSEAFVEDLYEDSRFFARPVAPRRRWVSGATLLCVVPLMVAVVGGAVAFVQLVG